MTALPPEVESNYDVLHTMGGGMGAVYKVRHRLFNEIRIIKVMQAGLADNAELKERFYAEARRGKQLEHKNIARVFDCQIGSNGNPYLVMEYVDGVNLRDEFSIRHEPLDPATVTIVGVQTLAALGYLHGKGLIHRDISPDNLMLTVDSDGSPLVKLIDLGISKSLLETAIVTRTGNFMGKLSYASPEQFDGGVDARSDIYSLGIVLYELLTCTKPITGATTAALIMAHYQMPPRPFSETDPQGRVPERLRRVILKSLEKDPADRYQSDDEFADALRMTQRSATIPPTIAVPPPPAPRISVARPAPHPPAPVTEIVPPPPRRSLWPFVAVAALVAFVVLAAATIFEKRNSKPVPAAVQMQSQPPPIASEPDPPQPPQPAGTSIAIEEPPPRRTTASAPPQIAIDTAPVVATMPPAAETTTSAASLPPTPVAVAQPAPLPQPTHGPDLAEGDRQRKLALAFSNAHDWENAVTAWRGFIRNYAGINASADHAAYYNLGVAYESLRQWSDAVDAFERARGAGAAGSADANNLLRLARCYGKLARWNDAARTYEDVLKFEPANDTAKKSLAWARRQPPRGN